MKNNIEKHITKSSSTQDNTYLFALPTGGHLASLIDSETIIKVFFWKKTKKQQQKISAR